MSTTVYLCLGSNLGDREKNIGDALRQITYIDGFELIASSPLYLNPAVGMKPDAPDFINMAVKGDYKYRPTELLNAVEVIEKKLGRSGKGKVEPRTIDIDIALFGDEVIEQEGLSIPHRKLTQRAFMIAPIVQIDPDIVHPVTEEKLAGYLKKKASKQMMIYKESIEIDA